MDVHTHLKKICMCGWHLIRRDKFIYTLLLHPNYRYIDCLDVYNRFSRPFYFNFSGNNQLFEDWKSIM